MADLTTSGCLYHEIGRMESMDLVGLNRTVYHCRNCEAVAVFIGNFRKWFKTMEALEKYLRETEGGPPS